MAPPATVTLAPSSPSYAVATVTSPPVMVRSALGMRPVVSGGELDRPAGQRDAAVGVQRVVRRVHRDRPTVDDQHGTGHQALGAGLGAAAVDPPPEVTVSSRR